MAVFEAPDSATAAAVALFIGGSGAFRSVATHELVSAAELVDVLRKAAAARPGNARSWRRTKLIFPSLSLSIIRHRPHRSAAGRSRRALHVGPTMAAPEHLSADLESVRGPRNEEAGQRVQLPRPVIVHAAPAASRAAQCGDPEPHTAPSLRDALRAPVTRPPRRAERPVRGSPGGAGSVR